MIGVLVGAAVLGQLGKQQKWSYFHDLIMSQFVLMSTQNPRSNFLCGCERNIGRLLYQHFFLNAIK